MNEEIRKQVNWHVVSRLGKNKFVKSFNIWIILVPILDKAMNNVNNLELFSMQLNWALPFNLKIFYACSLVFGLANVLYFIFCPRLIREYSNAGEFLSKGGSKFLINEFIESEKDIAISTISNDNEIKCKFAELSEHFRSKKPIFIWIVAFCYLGGFLLFAGVLSDGAKSIFFEEALNEKI